MRTTVSQRLLSLPSFLLALGALVWASAAVSGAQTQSAGAKSSQKTTVPASLAGRASAPKEASRGGLSAGIKVHGHWVIEVRNPDGKLVSHHEFENSLQTNGYGILANILSRQQGVGAWAIDLANAANASQGPCAGGGTNDCLIFEPNSSWSPWCSNNFGPQVCFGTLSVTPPSPPSGSNPPGATFSISGTAVAAQNGTISQVSTLLTTCTPGVSTASCISQTAIVRASAFDFTGAQLPAQGSGQCGGANQPPCAIPVAANQAVTATVTFSFQ